MTRDDIYDKLETLMDILTRSWQHETFCKHWLVSYDKISGIKWCRHDCPMALNNNGCALDEARQAVSRGEL